jgi:hypothetical protein
MRFVQYNKTSLLDLLVCGCKQFRCHIETEQLSRPKIDDKLKVLWWRARELSKCTIPTRRANLLEISHVI